MKNKWLKWASQMQSIAQAGLTFSENRYDLDRYRQLRNLSIEIINDYTDAGTEKVRELFASETGYQTPKVDIRASVFKDGKILMVKEKIDGAWSLPGGWADINTSPGESAVRECFEEAGARVKPGRIVAIQLADRHCDTPYLYSIYKIFVECELIENHFIENTETLDAGFFPLESLPLLSRERNTMEQIEMCFDARNKRLFEAVFD
jgi:ADP-ribose pyrophosphatase YjhB (NUDIX family)